MTNEEAIEILSGNFINVMLEDDETHADLYAKAFNMAVEALEKQSLEKPSRKGKCGCGEKVFKIFKYCPICGQALDWRSNE